MWIWEKKLYNLTLTIANIKEPAHTTRANTIRPCPGTALATRRFRPRCSLLYIVVNTISHLRTDITATSNMEDVNLKSVTLFSICFGEPPENKAESWACTLFCSRIILEKVVWKVLPQGYGNIWCDNAYGFCHVSRFQQEKIRTKTIP